MLLSLFPAKQRSAPEARVQTVVRRSATTDFSLTGLIYCALMLFMGLAALNSQANLLFGVFGLMIGILLVTFVISRMGVRRISVQRALPEFAVVGAPAMISYELRNDKRYWPSLSVTISELDAADAFVRQPKAYMLHAAPRMTAVVGAEVVPRRRGVHSFDRFRLSTSFPFGFVKRAIALRRRESVLVFPALAEVDPKLLAMMKSADSMGTTTRPRRGGSDEFYGIKEYRPGESPRLIYWRRSARTGTLVIKEMSHVSPPKLLLVVDTYATGDSSVRRTQVERCIAQAASLASAACDQGLSVGLVAWSDAWVRMGPNRGKRQRRELLSALARLANNSMHAIDKVLAETAELQGPATTIVVFTPDDVELNLGQRVHGGQFVIQCDSPQARRWFRFAPTVDFSHCMPQEA
ncbi:MAG: DUF58 domain-containing protein [Tepidisphaeraceae bacterium]